MTSDVDVRMQVTNYGDVESGDDYQIICWHRITIYHRKGLEFLNYNENIIYLVQIHNVYLRGFVRIGGSHKMMCFTVL